MSVRHLYFPAPGQQDALERAAALEATVARTYTDLILNRTMVVVSGDGNALVRPESYYDIPSLPAVVCDHEEGGYVVLAEPTTLAEVEAAHHALPRREMDLTSHARQAVAGGKGKIIGHPTERGSILG